MSYFSDNGTAQIAGLAIGNNDDVDVTQGTVMLTGNPGGAFTIRGLDVRYHATDNPFPSPGLLTIINNSGQVMTVNHQDAGSTAQNRIITGSVAAALTIANGGTVTLLYDNVTLRWRVIATT